VLENLALMRRGRPLHPSNERNPDPLFLAPDNAPGSTKTLGRYHEIEAIGNAERTRDVERGAGCGKIAYRTIDSAATELDSSGLEHAVAWGDSMFIHGDNPNDAPAKVFPKLNYRARAGEFHPKPGHKGQPVQCGRGSRADALAEADPR